MLVAQVLSLLYSIVDRIYIGRIPGEGTSALGGVGLCFPIIIMVTAFTKPVRAGRRAALPDRSRRQGNLRRASEVMNTAFSMLVLMGVVITWRPGELFASPLLRLFGATDGNLPHALAYLLHLFAGHYFHHAGKRTQSLHQRAGIQLFPHRHVHRCDRRGDKYSPGPAVHFRLRSGGARCRLATI